MPAYIQRGQLQIAQELEKFVREQALPQSGLTLEHFWQAFADILNELMPQNAALLAKRDRLQQQIDDYCHERQTLNLSEYKSFLQEIGYLQAAPESVKIRTKNVDAEIATMAGPQLVVPINNARYALNAVNARWGSLYDAAYGTDVIDELGGAERGSGYNPVRGQKVIAFARTWLDIMAPLTQGSHHDACAYELLNGALVVTLLNKQQVGLSTPGQYLAYQGDITSPSAILLQHHGLHAEIQIDKHHPIGKQDPAGIKDILLESALTTIMDCEDSVAAVDAQDKTLVYRNWLGLMNGTLSTEIVKGKHTTTRSMQADRVYTGVSGETLQLPGRSLMFVRNVGHLMTSNAILLDGQEIPEGIMDAIITCLIAKQDVQGKGQYRNSSKGSIYIVKPKMHGPEEVAFTDKLFARVEDALDLSRNTIKMGIMDEERRTSINLAACIAAAPERVVFINTGFLDRTGDEIHTSMLLGPVAPKALLKTLPWIAAYEKANVAEGLAAGLSGKAQIGKGMWAIPDQMANMMRTKGAQLLAGASTAWVPSPTAATLHALHYHQIDVFAQRDKLAEEHFNGLDDILTVPLLDRTVTLSAEQIQRELDNNVQGILGYVVRWVNQGVGCSKVPDLDNVGLMEDRATLRISSQHIANWLEHGLVSAQQVEESLQRMAKLVDEQNAGDSDYIAMHPLNESIAFAAAKELVFAGKSQPNGYTEPVLHAKRREMKAYLASRH
jgi:malate synthase